MTKFQQFSTICLNFWINFNTLETYDIVNAQDEFTITYDDAAGEFIFTVWDTTDTSYTVSHPKIASTGTWYMVTMIYDGLELKGAVDAEAFTTTTANGNDIRNLDSYIKFGQFDGKGQEFRIYNRTLSSSEIQQLYDIVNTAGILTTSKKTS